MPEFADRDAIERLHARYPDFSWSAVARVLAEAWTTVESAVGHADGMLAEDLAELRLQIRTRAGIRA